LLDIATPEITIRRDPKLARERSSVDCFWVLEIERQGLDYRIRESAKSDLPKYKGEFLEVNCGCRFPEREIEEPFPRALRARVRGKILCTWTFRTCG
jgi:hypothetical protein